MSIYNGIVNGQGFTTAIQLPGYSEIIQPSGLATAFAMEAAKGKTKSDQKDDKTGPENLYVSGMSGVRNQFIQYADRIEAEKNDVRGKLQSDFKKYGSYDNWIKNSPVAQEGILKLRMLNSEEVRLSRQLPDLNMGLRRFEEYKKRAGDSELMGEMFLNRVGDVYIPEIGAEGFKRYEEKFTDIWNEGDKDFEKTGTFSVNPFTSMYTEKYRGTFAKELAGYMNSAQGSMKEGSGGYGTLGFDENGNLKGGSTPGDLVGFLSKKETGSNYRAVEQVKRALYENLSEAAKYDLATDFWQNLEGGSQDENFAMLQNDANSVKIMEKMTETASGKRKPGKGETQFGVSNSEIDYLMKSYMVNRVRNQEDIYKRTSYDESLTKWQDQGTGEGTNPSAVKTYEQNVISPVYILDKGTPGEPMSIMEYNPKTKAWDSKQFTSSKMPIPSELYEKWNSEIGIKYDPETKSYVSVPIQNVPQATFGLMSKNGVWVHRNTLIEAGAELYSYGTYMMTGPALYTKEGKVTNVPMAGKSVNADGTIVPGKTQAYQSVVVRMPKEGFNNLLIGEDAGPGGSKKLKFAGSMPEDKKEGVISRHDLGFIQEDPKDDDYYLIEMLGVPTDAGANQGNSVPTKQSALIYDYITKQ